MRWQEFLQALSTLCHAGVIIIIAIITIIIIITIITIISIISIIRLLMSKPALIIISINERKLMMKSFQMNE